MIELDTQLFCKESKRNPKVSNREDMVVVSCLQGEKRDQAKMSMLKEIEKAQKIIEEKGDSETKERLRRAKEEMDKEKREREKAEAKEIEDQRREREDQEKRKEEEEMEEALRTVRLMEEGTKMS